MSWSRLKRGKEVEFYTASGWKKGVVADVYENSCTVLWNQGSTRKVTRVYDERNVRPIQPKR